MTLHLLFIDTGCNRIRCSIFANIVSFRGIARTHLQPDQRNTGTRNNTSIAARYQNIGRGNHFGEVCLKLFDFGLSISWIGRLPGMLLPALDVFQNVGAYFDVLQNHGRRNQTMAARFLLCGRVSYLAIEA
jgi:hypothetical protein